MTYDTLDDPIVGNVNVSVNDQKQITCTPNPANPDVNGNLAFWLSSTGPNDIWEYKASKPISIVDPNNFSHTLVSATQLNVTDTAADRSTTPTHHYTIHVVNQNGEEASFDPIIKDQTH